MKTFFKAKLAKLKAAEVKKAKGEKSKAAKRPKTDADYFKTAGSWASDVYTQAIVSRNRYKFAFFGMCGVSVVLSIALMGIAPLKQVELAVVHEGKDGNAWVSVQQPGFIPPANWARAKSEIANYIVNREGYDPLFYKHQSSLVERLSSPQVQTEYETSQESSNQSAPINLLGAKGYRSVTVNSIVQLDSESKNHDGKGGHVNLAQVNFTVTDHYFNGQQSAKTPYMAIVSWSHTGTSQDPQAMLDNWDGFEITKYQVQQVNVSN